MRQLEPQRRMPKQGRVVSHDSSEGLRHLRAREHQESRRQPRVPEEATKTNTRADTHTDTHALMSDRLYCVGVERLVQVYQSVRRRRTRTYP